MILRGAYPRYLIDDFVRLDIFETVACGGASCHFHLLSTNAAIRYFSNSIPWKSSACAGSVPYVRLRLANGS